MINNITEDKHDKYLRLAQLFKKYEGHKFNPFDKVLIYFKNIGTSHEFTIVPHIVWYYDENEGKYVLYDPRIRFTAQCLIPFEGNEEFIGFEGKNEIVNEIKKELQNKEEIS